MNVRFVPKAVIHGFFAFIIFSVMMGGATSLPARGEDEVTYPTLITASYKNGIVKIDFEPVGFQPDGRVPSFVYRIYRSKERMTKAEDLRQAVVVADVVGEENIPYLDTPEADGAYYYAVTLLRDKSESADLFPYQNTTMYPVEYAPLPYSVSDISISAVDRTTASVSFSPLGGRYTYYLFRSNSPFNDSSVEAAGTGTAGTGTAGTGTAGAVMKTEECCFKVQITEETPYYFLVTTANRMGIENKTVVPGENTNIEPFLVRKKEEKKQVKVKTAWVKPKPNASDLIERTLRRYFYRGRYTEALKSFETLLKRRDLSSSQRGRSYFYMGQCYYYSGKFKEAIRLFILCKSTGQYAGESELWIDRCLEKIE
jgi:hypothetical protein